MLLVVLYFQARYSELRAWYSDLKARGVISDQRIGVPFPGKHLMRNLKLGGAAAVNVQSQKVPAADVDVTQFIRTSVSQPLDTDDDYADDYSATALVEKRRAELCLWLEALLWRYPNLLKVKRVFTMQKRNIK